MTPAEAFGQYLELFKACPAMGQSAVLTELNNRCAAELPAAIEAYRSDVNDMTPTRPENLFGPDYGVNLNRVDMPADVAASFKCGVPQLNSLLAVVANDIYHPTDSIARSAQPGFTMASLHSLEGHDAADASEVMKTLCHGTMPELLNGLLLHDGVYIRADRGVDVDKPVQIVNIFNAPVPMLMARRIVIHACEGSHVRVLLCDHTQSPATASLSSQVVQVLADRGAKVELYDIEETSDSTNRVCTVVAKLADEASLILNSSYLHGGKSRNEYFIDLDGNHADANLSGLGICADEQALDNRVTLVHKGTHGTSRQLFKNVLFDKARGSFGGKIIVVEGAERTDAVQTNRNILASTEARMQTAPQLEIYCDDVKCGHGATTGQLDERALFYMQTRGIPREEALMMLTQAFMADVVDNISFEVLRQRLHILVEKRLNGSSGSCDTCATACHAPKQEEL